MTGRRADEMVRGLDIEAAIVAGMPEGDARRTMFSDAAIAASHLAEALGVGPYPVEFLADCVRSMGLGGALELPEPLIGPEPTALVRRWMSAAAGTSSSIERDELFARWLERVAMLIAVRRQVAPPGPVNDTPDEIGRPVSDDEIHEAVRSGRNTISVRPDAIGGTALGSGSPVIDDAGPVIDEGGIAIDETRAEDRSDQGRR
ncbi:hypothetical protein [Nocardia jiangxiensis]|uniref:hypothetical protein n=1 Tax=Nocardia jiangxiensis TaxID=282685 RepID=UPI0002D8750B|nr:hypothetical protein [Nocardia jiangxiensis]